MNNLDEKFLLIEKRVRALLAENSGLCARVRELERELAEARSAAGELALIRGEKLLLREKIEKILQTLESIGGET